jgi:hypothetical protein
MVIGIGIGIGIGRMVYDGQCGEMIESAGPKKRFLVVGRP